MTPNLCLPIQIFSDILYTQKSKSESDSKLLQILYRRVKFESDSQIFDIRIHHQTNQYGTIFQNHSFCTRQIIINLFFLLISSHCRTVCAWDSSVTYDSTYSLCMLSCALIRPLKCLLRPIFSSLHGCSHVLIKPFMHLLNHPPFVHFFLQEFFFSYPLTKFENEWNLCQLFVFHSRE